MNATASHPPRIWRRRVATLAVVLGVAVGFAAAVPHLKLTTQITDFLPDDTANRRAQIAALLAQSEVAKIMVIDLSASPPAKLHDVAQSLVAFLHDQPDVLVARSGFTDADVRATLAFLAAWPPTTFVPRTAYTDEALHERLADLADELGSPTGIIARQYAPRDPLGGMWEPVKTLQSARGSNIVDEDGVLMSADHAHAFVFVETRSSPFDSAAQQRFRATLDGWVKTSHARMQTAGAAQFAIATEAQIKRDVNRIGTISTIGILAIFLLLFGSVRMILIGFVPMVFGSAVAMLACQAIFGEIHGITIAFGTSLLGVGLDYVEHYYAHFVLTPDVPAHTTMKEVGPSLVFGALTTIIGFVGIAASGLMGLRQMAVFSVIAIIASMAATYWMVPLWMPKKYHAPRTLALVNRYVLRLLVRIANAPWSRTRRAVAVFVAILASGVCLRIARFSDNVNMLLDDTGQHVRDDRAVRARIGPESSTFAVVTADTNDALLSAIDRASGELERARTAGMLSSYAPVAQLLPSREEQAARFAAAREAAPRIRAAMTALDFVPDQFQPFWDALSKTPAFLTLADARRSPLAPLMAAWVPPAKLPLALIPLTDVKDLEALRAHVPSATIIAPSQTIVELFRGVRIQTVVSSVIGLLAIFFLLLSRYRRWRKCVVALTPGILACLATVGTLVVVGEPLTILHIMALLLVISMGVDFGIFFVDTVATREESARTMVSILTASITTILSFGLLALSGSPGLAALGVTVTLGVTYGALFCLVIASWTGHTARGS